jgi:hypothetical protein
MNYRISGFLIAALFVTACSGQPRVAGGAPSIEDVLISRGFIDNNTYRIVCRGYPQGGLDGIQKIESSKRGALLNAYYFVQNIFDDSVAPDKDGRVEKFEVMSDYAIVHYVISKMGLKKRVKR